MDASEELPSDKPPSDTPPSDKPPSDTNVTTAKSWTSDERINIGWICIYSLLLFLCFCVFVPVALTRINSNGYCLLYADNDGYGKVSVCDYCISITVIFMIYCTARVALLTLPLTKHASKVPACFKNADLEIAFVILDLLWLLLLLVSASIISAGFSHLCDLFGGSSQCSSADGVGLYPSGDVNYTFHTQLALAEGSSWFIFVLLVLAVAFKIIKFRKEGKLEENITKAKSCFGKK